MQKRKIGSLEVSAVGIGLQQLRHGGSTRRATAEVVGAALDAGIDFFDTADVYGKGERARSAWGAPWAAEARARW